MTLEHLKWISRFLAFATMVLCAAATIELMNHKEPPCRGRHITGTVGIFRINACLENTP